MILAKTVPSVEGFLQSPKFISLIIGPIGSTKTTAGIFKIMYHASQMAPCRDGIRRSRCIWVRNTREQLRDTSIPDFLKWYPEDEAGSFLKTENKFTLKMGDVECEVLFRPMEDSSDVRKLLSLQASFAVFEEFRELNKDIFEAMQGRLGRYPDGSMVPHKKEWGKDDKGNPIQGCVTEDGKPNKHLWGMSNAPDADTYWEDFITNPPANADIFIQPSGLSPEADWVHLLPTNYYEDLAEGKSEDYVDVYIHAKFGKSLQGKPVFRVFSKETHMAKETLRPNRISTNPIIVGFDCTGLNPAAAIGQLGFEGRLLIYDELVAEDMGALRFIREKLKPLLANKYAGFSVLCVIDPAGIARGADEKNVADMLKAEGLRVIPAKTNGISARLAAVEQFLTRFVDGKPGIVFDPGCVVLAEALRSKYRYKRNQKGEFADTPDKTHPWGDVVDSLQYLCLHADGGGIFGGIGATAVKRPVQRVAFAT